ncbi:MAG: tRNA (adenosine(37)-N6)-dimethylallyltransferase MiaA [Bacteroidota bacterium]
MNKLLVILGPTATGKTSLAASVCDKLNGAVISADSRQVYRMMNMGTGKDLNEYDVNGNKIPYYLIDIADPGEEYNLFRFIKDYNQAIDTIHRQDKLPVLCGGTGLYIEAIIDEYMLSEAPPDNKLRHKLVKKSIAELTEILKSYRQIHNTTDILSEMRLMRAIEIEEAKRNGASVIQPMHSESKLIFGIRFSRQEIKDRITQRLKKRLEEGMIDEINALLTYGVSLEKLDFFGLEYRYISAYVNGKLSYNDMFQKLNAAIHDFAKRQETWFRRMERKGCQIHWIDGNLSLEEKTKIILDRFDQIES